MIVKSVQTEDVPLYVDAVGTVDGMVNAEVRARVPGYILTQVYKDGTFVKKGDLLFTIDPSLTQAATKKSEGDLQAMQAVLMKSEIDLRRAESLEKQDLASKQDLDNAKAAHALAQANVTAAQGTLATAATNLSYSRIVAPISGLAGIAKVRVGSLVGQTDATLLTTVSQIDTVRVTYPISEQWYLSNPKKFLGSTEPTLDLFLSDGSRYPQKGTLNFIDRQVDPSTGTLTVMATFPNPDGLLRPGMFAKVRDVREVKKDAILIPQRAVAELQGSQQVIVIGAGDKAEVRAVTLGERVGSRWLVESGLKVGERYVVEGLQKARPGTVVAPKNAPPLAPAASGETAKAN